MQMYLKHHYEETIINRKYGICNFYSEIWRFAGVILDPELREGGLSFEIYHHIKETT